MKNGFCFDLRRLGNEAGGESGRRVARLSDYSSTKKPFMKTRSGRLAREVRRIVLSGLLFAVFVMRAFAQAPVITSPPLTKLATVGQAVSFAVVATGAAPLSYQWKHNGQVVSGATDATMSIAAMALSDRGWYQVIVSNSAGSAKSVFMLNGANHGRAPGSWAKWNSEFAKLSSVPPSGLTDVVAIAGDRIALKSDGTVVTWEYTIENGAASPTVGPVPSGLNNVVAVTGGGGVLAVKADGTVVAWGSNIHGPLAVPAGLDQVVAVAAGSHSWLALRADGRVVETGSLPFGSTSMPVGLEGVVAIAAGSDFSMAVRDDGTVVAWGGGYYGEINVPVGLTGVVGIACGSEHILALRSEGTVAAWGRNTEGQTSVPTDLSNVVGIAAGSSNSFALKSDGTVVGWGWAGINTLPIPLGIAGVEAISAAGNGNLVLMPAVVPQISTQPATTTVTSGGRVILSVASTGTPPFFYQWKKDGVALSDGAHISGSTTSLLVIDPVAALDAGGYTAEVTNGFGTTSSDAAGLTVNVPPTIVTRPLSTIATLGQPVGFSITATGAAPLSYQWKHNGQVIIGATDAALIIPSVAFSDRGTYEVIVSNPLASAESVFCVNVAAGPPGQTGVVQWGGQTGVVFTGYGGAVDSPPLITGDIVAVASSDDAGLLLRGDGTVTSWGGNNVFQSAFVPSGLSNVVAIAISTDHGLALKADGVPVSWGAHGGIPAGLGPVVAVAAGRRNDVFLKADGSVVVSLSGTVIGPSVELTDVTAVAAGYDFYLALKKDGTVGGSLAAPAGLAGVVAVAAGEHHALALKSDGTVAAWGGANADGETTVPAGLTNVIAVAAGSAHSLALKSDGTVVMWGRSTEKQGPPPPGLVDVVGIAAGGNSSVALVRASLPAISAQPAGGVRNVGKYLSLSVTASAQPNPTYQWTKDGVALADGGNVSGATSAQLMIANAQTGDAGSYAVTVTNGVGSVTSDAVQITMVVPPTVTVRPLSRILAVGQSAVFNADATDTLPLTFQWKHNSQVIPGATDKSFSLSGATKADAGFYEFSATNSAGGTLRSVFNVSVVPSNCVLNGWGSNTFGETTLPAGLIDLRGIAAGGAQSLAINSDGTVVAWGDYSGTGHTVPVGLANVVGVAAGTYHKLALTAGGTVAAWGYNGDGETNVPAGLSNVVAVAAGSAHSLALRADGTVVGWGSNANGQIAIPVGLDDAVGVSASGNLSLIIRVDGSILALGAGSATAVPPGTSNAIAAAAGSPQGVALKGDGTVVGLGGSMPPSGLGGVTAIAAGGTQQFALKADGFVVGWGSGSSTLPAGLSEVAAIAAGGGHGLALIVTHPPAITTQPVGLNVSSGTTVTFTVTASGTGPLGYQWQFNGLAMRNGGNVSGATAATLTLTNVQGADVGSYTVTVTNAYGVATSDAATLAGPPPIPGQAQVTATAGYNLTLNVSISGGTPTFQWRRNGVVIAGATGPSFLLGNVSRGDAANYDVVMSDGTNTSTSKIVRVLVAPTSYPGKIVVDPTVNIAAEIVTGWVYATAVAPDGKIYVGGEFSSINRILRSRVARFNANGTLDPTFVPIALNGAVNCILPVANGRVWIGGDFSNVQGVAHAYSHLARLQADGSLDESVAVGSPDSTVLALALQSDGKLLYGGKFASSAQGINSYLARLNADGSSDAAFHPSIFNVSTGGIWTVAVQDDGKIVAGGRFNFAGTTSQHSGSCIARFNADGSLDPTFGLSTPGANNNVYQVALQPDGKILACGAFTSVNGTAVGRVARFTSTGAFDPTFDTGTGLNASGYALQLQAGGKVVLGGAFTSYNGAGANVLIRLNPDGSRDASFTLVPNSSVTGIAQQAGGELIIVGYFYGIDSSYRFGVARIAVDDSLDASLNPLPLYPGTVNALLAMPGGKVLVGGDFQLLGGIVVSDGLARLNANLSVDTTFNPGGAGADAVVTRLAPVGDGRVWVSGDFSHVNNVVRGKLARLNADGSVDTQFDPGAGPQTAPKAMVEMTAARVAIGGDFVSYDGQLINNVAVVRADGTLDPGFNPGAGAGTAAGVAVHDLLAQPGDKLLVGGAFSSFSGQTADSLVRLLATGAVDSSFPVGSSLFGVSAMKLQADGRFLLGGDALLARLNADGTRDTLFNPPLLQLADDFIAQEDGKILVRGIIGAFSGSSDTAYVARLNADGTRDTSFAMFGLTSRPTAFLVTDNGRMLIGGGGTPGLAVTAVALPPTISSPPQPQTAGVGTSVTFTVAVGGMRPLAYQWFKDGNAIPGATGAALVLNNVASADGGGYGVTVTNLLGSATSSSAILTVFVPVSPSVITPPQGQTVAVGASPTLTVVAGGTAPFTYQWTKDGANIAGATSDTLALTGVQTSASGGYAVVVTNAAGSITSATALLTVVQPFAPAVSSPPQKGQVNDGAPFTFTIVAGGFPSVAYQWLKNDVPVDGATTSLLTFDRVGFGDAGNYSVTVTNNLGSVTSASAPLVVIPAGLSATHGLTGAGYVPGSTITVSNTFAYGNAVSDLTWQVLLPAGWSLSSSAGAAGGTPPAPGATGLVEWTWTTAPVSPLVFSYTLNVPADATGDQTLAALITVSAGAAPVQFLAQPDPLPVRQILWHSADTGNGITVGTPDGKIELTELLRVIELYNTRNGTVRTGAYAVDASNAEDGFAGDSTRSNAAGVTLPRYHSADTGNGVTLGTPDGRIELTELLRMIELYNYRNGSVRTGQYHAAVGTEDGFAPGP